MASSSSSPLHALKDGGVAVLFSAHAFDVPAEYAKHPRIMLIPCADMASDLPSVAGSLPPNTKIILMAGTLPAHQYGLATKAAERRQVPYITRRSLPALRDTLTQLLAQAKAPEATNGDNGDNGADAPAASDEAAAAPNGAPGPRTKGWLGRFIAAHVDYTQPTAQEARRLLTLAQAQGIATTFGSLSQGISDARRKGGRTAVPRSIQSAHVKALGTLDEAIAGLQLIREYVEATEKENLELRALRERFRSLLGDEKKP